MAEAQLTNTLAQVKQKQAVLRQAQIDVDRTYIRAPVTGTVVNRAVSGGQTVAASLQSSDPVHHCARPHPDAGGGLGGGGGCEPLSKSVSRSPLPWMPILGACSPAP